eukprot:4922916-Alexandrium_andersonii.AAC.1
METAWWHFSKAWKEEVTHCGGRVLSFSRSRHLTDFSKVVAYLSTTRDWRSCGRRMNEFLEREAASVAMDYDAAVKMADEAKAG